MIITYHRIKDNEFSCSPKEFERQLEMAKNFGWTLTFDDGLKEHFTIAFPLLQKLNLRAMFFPITGSTKNLQGEKWKNQEFMTLGEIKKLHEAGMIIGGHTHTHPRLSSLSNADQTKEISLSTSILENVLKDKLSVFSYPFGDYNNDTIDILRKVGYKMAFTAKPQDPFQIFRNDTNDLKDWIVEKRSNDVRQV